MKTFALTIAFCFLSLATFAAISSNQLPTGEVNIQAIIHQVQAANEATTHSEVATTSAEEGHELSVKNRYDRIAELRNPLYTTTLLA